MSYLRHACNITTAYKNKNKFGLNRVDKKSIDTLEFKSSNEVYMPNFNLIQTVDREIRNCPAFFRIECSKNPYIRTTISRCQVGKGS